jgi:hypothetical protein
VKFVKLINKKDFGYRFQEASEYPYEILGFLLTEEAIATGQKFRRFINDPEIGFAGNLTLMDKNDDNTIRLYFGPAMELSEDEKQQLEATAKSYFTRNDIILSREDFLHIIDEWTKANTHQYDEFWIKYDNGIFWAEGVK